MQAVRADTVHKIEQSAFVAQLIPGDDFDVKFAVELGIAIMLDKPILAIVMPGRTFPGKLAQIADVVVQADLDTEDGQRLVREGLAEMQERVAARGRPSS